MKTTRTLLTALILPLMLSGCLTLIDDFVTSTSNRPREVIDPAMIEAAQIAEARGDHETAAGYYRSVHKRDPNNVEVTVSLSQMLRKAGKNPEALEIMTAALDGKPENAALLIEMGKVYLSLNRPQDAVTTLEKAREVTPGDWQVYSPLGIAYDYAGQPDLANVAYQTGLGFSPDNSVLLNNYALSLAQNGALDDAIDLLQKAVEKKDATPRMRQNLALLTALKGDAAAAEKLAREDLSPDMAEKNAKYFYSLQSSGP